MKRCALLTLTVALLLLPASGAAAASTDGVPLMPVHDFKLLPGTPVPITPPAAPRPCAPVLKGPLAQLPGQLIAIEAPRLRR